MFFLKFDRGEEEELLELLWQNGQVVTQSQNQRCGKRSPPLKLSAAEDGVPHGRQGTGAGDEIESSATAAAAAASHLFMQEDEMASWLHYPIEESFDRDFCSDLLYPASVGNSAVAGRSGQADRRLEEKAAAAEAPTAAAPSRPPLYPARRGETEAVANFAHFSRGKGKGESRPSNARESTVVDSSDTPPGGDHRVRVLRGEKAAVGSVGGNTGCGSTCGDREMGTCEGTLTSSSGVSCASADRASRPAAEDRKRKTRLGEESEEQSEVSVSLSLSFFAAMSNVRRAPEACFSTGQ